MPTSDTYSSPYSTADRDLMAAINKAVTEHLESDSGDPSFIADFLREIADEVCSEE